MCSPGAAEHTDPGNRPKGTDQSVQESFCQDTRNNCRGQQEGIRNKAIHWTAVASVRLEVCVCLSVIGVSLPLSTTISEMCSHCHSLWIIKVAEASTDLITEESCSDFLFSPC